MRFTDTFPSAFNVSAGCMYSLEDLEVQMLTANNTRLSKHFHKMSSSWFTSFGIMTRSVVTLTFESTLNRSATYIYGVYWSPQRQSKE